MSSYRISFTETRHGKILVLQSNCNGLGWVNVPAVELDFDGKVIRTIEYNPIVKPDTPKPGLFAKLFGGVLQS